MADPSSPTLRGKDKENNPPSSPKKRVIDPESDSLSKRRSLVVLAQSTGHPHSSAAPFAVNTRHVKLPVDLRDRNVKIEGSVLEMLRGIFPDTESVGEGGNRVYLTFTVKKLPTAPWPLTIGGLPITICEQQPATYGKGPMFPSSMPGNMSIRVCNDIDARSMSLTARTFRSLADTVTRAVLNCIPGLAVVEFILDAEKRFHVVLKDDVDIVAMRNRLPGRIAKCWTMYTHDKNICRAARDDRKALRNILPDAHQGIVDVTPYEVLRPGVLITSPASLEHDDPLAYSTTSGVLVKNHAGDPFMTSATHGIGLDERVYQRRPASEARIIGKAVVEISFTDISLVQLENGIEFVNEVFEVPGETMPPFTQLIGESPDDEIDMGTEVFLNSPQTGAMSGIMLCKSWRVVGQSPAHPTEDRLRYVVYDWAYLGQIEPSPTTLAIPDGTCGSVIWDERGRVAGFFHYHIEQGEWKGFCASVSADELVRAGYRLA